MYTYLYVRYVKTHTFHEPRTFNFDRERKVNDFLHDTFSVMAFFKHTRVCVCVCRYSLTQTHIFITCSNSGCVATHKNKQ